MSLLPHYRRILILSTRRIYWHWAAKLFINTLFVFIYSQKYLNKLISSVEEAEIGDSAIGICDTVVVTEKKHFQDLLPNILLHTLCYPEQAELEALLSGRRQRRSLPSRQRFQILINPDGELNQSLLIISQRPLTTITEKKGRNLEATVL